MANLKKKSIWRFSVVFSMLLIALLMIGCDVDSETKYHQLTSDDLAQIPAEISAKTVKEIHSAPDALTHSGRRH